MVITSAPAEYERQARQLFSTAPDRHQQYRTNPVTGSHWLNGVDPIAPQIKAAGRALAARDQFAKMAPHAAPPLPLSYQAREASKIGGLPHLVAWFARSLEAYKYDFGMHPYFEPYARGVLASPYAPHFIVQDATLQRLFAPRPLKGLGSGLYWGWSPARIRHASRFKQHLFLNGDPPPQFSANYNIVSRHDANVPTDYAPNSQSFLQLDDDFVAHATKLAPYKRLPHGWRVHKPAEVFSRVVGAHKLWVRAADYGWLIEREDFLSGEERVLANVLLDAPVLCDTYVTAARTR